MNVSRLGVFMRQSSQPGSLQSSNQQNKSYAASHPLASTLHIDSNPDILFIEVVDSDEAAQVFGGAVSLDRTALKETAADRFEFSPRDTGTAEWSGALQQVLDQPPSSLPLRLAAAGILFCGMFGVWAWTGKMQEVSRAQGKLVPQGEVFKVQPIEQGEIARVFVKEGQAVEAGQVIAELDNRLLLNEVDRLEQSMNAYRMQLFQIQGTIDRTRQELVTRQAIAAAAVQAQESALLQATAQTNTSRATLIQLHAESAALQERLDRLQPLASEGAIAMDQLFTAQQSIREQERLITEKNGEIEKAEAQAAQVQAEVEQRIAEGQQSELETRKQVQRLEVEASQLRAQIAETENLLRAAKTKLTQTTLRAPVDGIVSALKVQNPGEVTQPGQTLAEIMPAGVPLVMSAILPNDQAGLVKVGMPVQVKFDAFPYQTYGVISGRVTKIAPNAESNSQLGEVYRIEIKLDTASVQAIDQQIPFRSGQTASAEIVTRDRRIADVLLDPIRTIQKGGLQL